MRLPAGGRVASGDTASLLAGGATRSDKRLTLLSFSSSSCASAASAAVLGAPRPKRLAKLARQIPIGRVGEPDDVAYGVLYLASDESRMMTGAELKLDGGISAM